MSTARSMGAPGDERTLFERLVDRDAHALAHLYDASSAAVFAVALRVTGDRPLHRALRH